MGKGQAVMQGGEFALDCMTPDSLFMSFETENFGAERFCVAAAFSVRVEFGPFPRPEGAMRVARGQRAESERNPGE